MKINIVMITYNHEKFIEQAINSILMQKCNFELELILSNDCSSDKTDEVIQNLLKDYPKNIRIKYLNHKKNIGPIANFVEALKNCNGKYIALCDGDDYWTDSLKLQKQVDFLENNPDYNIVGHSVSCSSSNEVLENKLKFNIDKKLTLRQVVQQNPIHTSSFFFRNMIDLKKNPLLFQPFSIGDYPLLVLLSQPKGLFVFKDTMSTYRNDHLLSEWSGKLNKAEQKKQFAETLGYMIASSDFSNKTKKYINNKLKRKSKNILKKVFCKIKKK